MGYKNRTFSKNKRKNHYTRLHGGTQAPVHRHRLDAAADAAAIRRWDQETRISPPVVNFDHLRRLAAAGAEVTERRAAEMAALEEWADKHPTRKAELSKKSGKEYIAAVNEAIEAEIQSKIIDVANGNSTFRDLSELQKLIAFQPKGGTRKYRRKPRRKLKSRRK